MASLPPNVQTYHCLCSSLLLTTTHNLSDLPRRSTNTGGLDSAIILPLPNSAPDFTNEHEKDDTEGANQQARMPEEGYSILLGMNQDRNVTIVRREDGFEKRLLWRCLKCRLVSGYEISGTGEAEHAMDVDVEGKGKGRDDEEYKGKVIYLLPGGIMSTDIMAAGGKLSGGRKISEEDVNVKGGSVGVFE